MTVSLYKVWFPVERLISVQDVALGSISPMFYVQIQVGKYLPSSQMPPQSPHPPNEGEVEARAIFFSLSKQSA